MKLRWNDAYKIRTSFLRDATGHLVGYIVDEGRDASIYLYAVDKNQINWNVWTTVSLRYDDLEAGKSDILAAMNEYYEGVGNGA